MWFKPAIPVVLIWAALFACAPAKKSVVSPKPQKIEFQTSDQDSVEYELIIIDPGFETWMATNHKPKWYYSKEFLATWNQQYVQAWNEKVRNPLEWQLDQNSPFVMEIDYRPGIDYGLDLNYTLYHYFRYVEKTWGKILPYSRHN